MNSCQFGGRIVTDITLREVGQNKISVGNFTIAINRSYKKKDGSWEQKSSFARCVIWAEAAISLHKNYKKGDVIYIESALETESWTDTEGKKRSDNKFRVTNFYRPVGFKKSNENSQVNIEQVQETPEEYIPF